MTRAAIIAALFAAFLTRAQYLMGTVCEIDADVSAGAAFAECARIESMISTWRDDSELSRVNRGATPSAELASVLAIANDYKRETEGAFDPHIRALLNKWHIREPNVIPSVVEGPGGAGGDVKRATPPPGPSTTLGMTKLDYEEGGFAKGYAIDRMLDLLRDRGAKHAVINFGGQIGTLAPTEVTIADPKQRDHPVVALTLQQRSLSTSSTSEKPNHIIDPRSGVPVPARGSVSVIHDSALVADILSTALYVMGREHGLEWARAHHVLAIFIDHDFIETSAPVPGIRVLDAHFKLKD
ncbi:MAG TPA: FAD:protein FMN transferase [Thermoanaerobaculia bacterium]|nr:FAD:protein FMN transferase [Thermoanaerobaculia bacterium]